MSYDDSRGSRGGGGTDPSEYGGGGRGSDNYYDQRNRFDDSQSGYGQDIDSRTGGGRYGHGIGSGHYDDNEVVSHANSHSGSSGDSNLFSQALSFLNNRKKDDDDDDVDERKVVNAHQQVYHGSSNETHSAQTVGAAAAMQALKMFSGGSGGGQPQSQSQFIGLAMAEASKLFDRQGGSVSGGGDKQSVVNEAGKMALKMYLKGQVGGGGGSGGGSGGGAAGLLNLASKFLK